MKRGLKKAAQAAIKWKYVILFVLTGIILVLDQVTKNMIISRFRLGESIPIITDYFNLTYVQNKGAAFGILAQANPAFRVPFFIIVPLIALGTIAFVFKKIGDKDIKLSVALSLVIAGAIGNLVDRLTLGYVIDFLDFHWRWGYHFPAFNVADSAICVGVGVLMLDLVVNDTDALSTSQKKGSRLNASHTR